MTQLHFLISSTRNGKLPTWRERVAWVFALFRAVQRKRKDYDLLHVHVLWWGSLLLGLWAKARKIPILYESILEGADNPSVVRREGLGKLKLALHKTYSAILAISPALADDFLANGFRQEQVFTLTNPVDTLRFHPTTSPAEKRTLRGKLGLPQNKTLLLFVGSLIHREGVDLLVEALLHSLRTNGHLHLVLAGADKLNENPSLDITFINGLQERISRGGAASSVTFTGLIGDRERLSEFFRAADIFVFPSRNEGLGNVVLEAMSSGLPCLTSALPVLQTVIRDGQTGGDGPSRRHCRAERPGHQAGKRRGSARVIGQYSP